MVNSRHSLPTLSQDDVNETRFLESKWNGKPVKRVELKIPPVLAMNLDVFPVLQSKMVGEAVRAVVNYCECVWVWKEKTSLAARVGRVLYFVRTLFRIPCEPPRIEFANP